MVKYTFLYHNNLEGGRLEERDIMAASLLEAAEKLDSMFCGFADIVELISAE